MLSSDLSNWLVASHQGTPAAVALNQRVGATLRYLRSEQRLTIAEMASRTRVARAHVQAYEEGTQAPTYQILGKFSPHYQADLVAFFEPQFTGEPVPEREWRKASNASARLQHLLNLVATGRVVRLTHALGMSESPVRTALRRNRQLPDECLAVLYQAFPTLQAHWLETGGGPIFSDGFIPHVPTHFRREPEAPARPAGPPSTTPPPPPARPTLPGPGQSILSGFQLSELTTPTTQVLQRVSERLRRIGSNGGTLSSRQVLELASFLGVVPPTHFLVS